jgi:hypothetical protein
MKRLCWTFGLLFLALLLGCEREKRTDAPATTAETTNLEQMVEVKRPLLDESGWLSVFGKDAQRLTTFAESSVLWSALLQGRYLDVLIQYDRLRTPTEADGLACARASLELASTAHVLEKLLRSIQVRILEIQGSRTGVKDTARLRSHFAAQSQVPLKLALPTWSTARPSFLASETQLNTLDEPTTSSYRARWSVIEKLRASKGGFKTETFLKRAKRLSGADFEMGQGDSVFEFIDLAVAGVSRHFFARKANDCLAKVKTEADLLRIRALRLAGDRKTALNVLKAHTVPQSVPMGLQLLTLETSVDAYEQALRVESAALGLNPLDEQVKAGAASVPFTSIRSGLAIGLGTDEKAKSSISVEVFDPVLLSRAILAQLNIGKSADETTTTTLIARYVEEVLRQTADVHYLKGEFARSAQIRRRIGGTDAFVMGAKVPPSALAKCALEHWKIVEPRSAIRYLKDLATIFPNAKRSAGLLRDVLSYRARQSGGQTAAGQ